MERQILRMKLLLLFPILFFQFLYAQSTELTIVYTNNTNGNLENCV